MPQRFFWYELMTSDAAAAVPFYTDVMGWRAEPVGPADDPYTVMYAGERGVGGVMTLPQEACDAGARPGWLGYIRSADVDADTRAAAEAGGAVLRPPHDIPQAGRFSVVADPQGAAFMLLQPSGPDRPPVAQAALGHVGWHELYAGDVEAVFPFYAGRFGWTKAEAVDMGPMGTYQLFAAGGDPVGGMMNKPAQIPSPVWLFYFNVEAADAALARVTGNGGQVLMGPMQVPGGSWVAQCMDPQGAVFALTAPVR
ncbi:MAG: VOC family protein [Alphaproteobacteria bacterium]|nr:VOC family protein [Alphaproteobacteria bacterium]